MKSKFINLMLIITSLLGYLEWGTTNSGFLFQFEGEVLSKFIHNPTSVIHPFTVLPLLGQLILLFTLFQNKPGRMLSLVGLGCVSVLLLLIFVIGIITLNYKIALSAVPFLVTGVVALKYYWKKIVVIGKIR